MANALSSAPAQALGVADEVVEAGEGQSGAAVLAEEGAQREADLGDALGGGQPLAGGVGDGEGDPAAVEGEGVEAVAAHGRLVQRRLVERLHARPGSASCGVGAQQDPLEALGDPVRSRVGPSRSRAGHARDVGLSRPVGRLDVQAGCHESPPAGDLSARHARQDFVAEDCVQVSVEPGERAPRLGGVGRPARPEVCRTPSGMRGGRPPRPGRRPLRGCG